MKVNQFDLIASVYDQLAGLVFGKSLYKAQTCFLDQLPDNGRVLIVGGGTGQILKEAVFSRAAQIDFVELSEKMITKARQNGSHLSQINFLNEDFFQHHGEYDFVIANFFLDCFDGEHLTLVVQRLKGLLSTKGKILVTDFQNPSRTSHRILIFLMIAFFKTFSSLQASRLEDIQGEMVKRFSTIMEKSFKQGLLFSALYAATEQ